MCALKAGAKVGENGRYQLVRRLGEGGCGEVWLARDRRRSNHRYAIKFFRPGLSIAKEVVKREWSNQSKLGGHSNILRLYDHGVHTLDSQSHWDYIVMEYCPGGDLTTVIAEAREGQSRYSLKTRLEMGLDACLALAHAHDNGIVHRDLKPNNFLVASDHTLKVADFGISRDVAAPKSEITFEGRGAGSYRAPEAHPGAKYDEKLADQYSLGRILYELLTLQSSITKPDGFNDQPEATRFRVRSPREITGEIPQRLSDCVMAMRDENPTNRGSLSDVITALSQAARTMLPRPSASAVGWLTRRRIAVTASALVLGVLVVVPIVIATRLQRQAASTPAIVWAAVLRERGAREASADQYAKALWYEILAMEQVDGAAVVDRLRMAHYFGRMAQLHCVAETDAPVRFAYMLTRPDHAFVTGDESGQVAVWAWSPSDSRQQWTATHGQKIESMLLSPDGLHLVTTAKDDPFARIWDFTASGSPAQHLLEHDSPPTLAAFSGDGKRVVTVDQNGFVRTWESSTGTPWSSFGARGPIGIVALNRDGSLVVTGCQDDPIRLWKSEPAAGAGTLHREFRHDGKVNDLVFAFAGERVLSASDDKSVRIWDFSGDAERALERSLAHVSGVKAVRYAGEAGKIVTLTDDQRIWVWDADDGALTDTPNDVGSPINSVRISGDGRILAVAAADGIARVVSLTKSDRTVFMIHPLPVLDVRLDHAAEFAVTVCGNANKSTARIWYLGRDHHLGRGIRLPQLNADGSRILAFQTVPRFEEIKQTVSETGGAPETEPRPARDVRDEEVITQWEWSRVDESWRAKSLSLQDAESARGIWYSGRDDRFIVGLCTDKSVRIWNTADLETSRPRVVERPSVINAAALSPDGSTLATGEGPDAFLTRLGRTESAQTVVQLPGRGPIEAIAFSVDGNMVAVGYGTGVVTVFDTATGRRFGADLPHGDQIRSIRFGPSAGSRRLLTVCKDESVTVWQFDADGESRSLARLKHESAVKGAYFLLDEQCVITASADGSIRVWSVEGGETILGIEHIATGIRWCDASPDAGWLVITEADEEFHGRVLPVPSPRDVPENKEALRNWAKRWSGITMDRNGFVEALNYKDWLDARNRLE